MSRQAKPAWRGGRRDDLNNRGCPDYTMTAGSLDLRSELEALDTLALAYQGARLIDLPDELRDLTADRLRMAIAELNQRAAAAIGEVRP